MLWHANRHHSELVVLGLRPDIPAFMLIRSDRISSATAFRGCGRRLGRERRVPGGGHVYSLPSSLGPIQARLESIKEQVYWEAMGEFTGPKD